MNKRFISLAVAMMTAWMPSFAQKTEDLKYYDVRELGLPILNQGFKDCVRIGSSEKDAQVKDAADYDSNMQKTERKTKLLTADGQPVNDGYYTRLSARIEHKVRPAVWGLGQCSTGLAVRFRTNTRTIGARWTLLNNSRMSHMAPTGICGFDLYALDKGEWRYAGTAQPTGKESANIFVRNMDEKMREFVAFFPLYDGVINLAIGIDEGAVIEQPEKTGNNLFGRKATTPLVFYGTSVTQGGCANRPGMAHTNILSRMLGRECINLGFSGNGKMDRIIAEEMTQIDAGAYIIDCLGNCSLQQIKDSTMRFIHILAEARPNTPIIMVSNYPYQNQWLSKERHESVKAEDDLWLALSKQLRAEGLKNVRYLEIGGKHCLEDPMKGSATGPDHEGAVDGCHLTDLGFLRMAEFLYPYLKKLK